MSLHLLPPDLHLEMGPLGTLRLELQMSEEGRRVAREELRETEDVVPAALAELRRLLKEDKELHVPMDDNFLRALLRPAHWYPVSAYKRLRSFCAFTAKHPHVGRSLPPERMDAVAGSGVVCIMPRRDQLRRRVLLLQGGSAWDPKLITIEEILAGVLMCLQLAMAEPDTQVAGSCIIWDLLGLNMSQVFKFTPSFAKMLVTLIQDSVAMRVKGFHFVNQTHLFDIAFNVIKPFLGEKLRKRIFLHGKNRESLAKYIDPKLLPKQYGGELDFVINAPKQMAVFRSVRPYYEDLDKYGFITPPK